MLTIEQVDTTNKKQVKRFIDVPFRLYQGNSQWVPPIRADMKEALNRNKHPFYEHSSAAFFLANREGRDIGRIAALENRNYNSHHGTKTGQFYFFDCEDDSEGAARLFEAAFEWAKGRGLNKITGPKGFSVFDGYGMLERGYEYRQMMNMMNYNNPYYLRMAAESGLEKEVDYISHLVAVKDFKMPERVHSIADRVLKRKKLHVIPFRNKRELREWAPRIGQAYNDAFIKNWEYVPLTDRELDYVVDNIMLVANPKLIKIIARDDQVVGFAFGWPDVSAAMQRSKGNLFPIGIFDLLLEMRRTTSVAGNGMGMLPEYQGLGGNALLYTEMEKSLSGFNFVNFELTQVAETAVQMRKDLETLGGIPYKNHRVFSRSL